VNRGASAGPLPQQGGATSAEPYGQPRSFLEESEALYALLAPRPESDLSLVTQFKAWTVEDVVAHLHFFNRAAEVSTRGRDELKALVVELKSAGRGRSFREATLALLAPLRGRALLEAWREGCDSIAAAFEAVDPRRRLPWFGPDMSARSSISARLMETWAHGQAVFDRLGIVRVDTDRLRDVTVLGVNTFAWTFRNRGLAIPPSAPRVRLEAPSGARWEWNPEVESDLVEGTATEFCQVVAQTRALADTSLRVDGDVARRWMSIAQCFAGPPENPPAPGSRVVQRPS
jgi:uncharacterized protein (TIGR03084 family)